MISSRRTRTLAAATLAASLVAFGLAGCTPSSPTPSPSSGAGASDEPSGPNPSDTASPSPTSPSPTPSVPVDESAPVGVDCGGMITLQELYDFNPNFSGLANYTPAAGSAAATAVAAQGIACGYVNQTSGATIVISAARPGPTALASLTTQLNSSAQPTTLYGGNGWFGAATATVISGTAWVTIHSPYFTEAADAQQLMASALPGL